MSQNKGPRIVIGEPLPEQALARLLRRRERVHSETNPQNLVWPDPASLTFDRRDDLDLNRLSEALAEGLFPVHPGIVELEVRRTRRGGKSQRRRGGWPASPSGSQRAKQGGKRRSGGSRGKQSGGGQSGQRGGGQKRRGGQNGKQWPDPAHVAAVVRELYRQRVPASNEGNAQVAALNMEYGNRSKILYFAEAIRTLIGMQHVHHLSEVDKGGVAEIAELTGYQTFCSSENSRGQAVGLAVNPRMDVVAGPIEYDRFKDIQNIPDLRPALRVDVVDRIVAQRTGLRQRVIHVVVHCKSMLGGALTTGAIRYQQFEALMVDLADEIEKIQRGDPDAAFGIVIAGDVNFRVNRGFSDDLPLRNRGFQLVAPGDQQQTHTYSADSRIDAMYVLGFGVGGVGYYRVVQFFRHLGRTLTDHGQIELQELTVSPEDTAERLDVHWPDSGPGGTASTARGAPQRPDDGRLPLGR